MHRDVKPANILLENGIDRPVVTDFGLVRVVDDATLTASGAIAGTPNYMSPEQAGAARVDPRSDLFSLGSVMYAMCVGHPPFRADTVLGVIRRVCDDTARPVCECNFEIPDWLSAFIEKLLAKDRDDRFGSAEEVESLLAEELAHLQNPTAVPVPGRSWWAIRAPKAASPLKLVLACVACLGIIAAGLFFEPPRDKANTNSDAISGAGSSFGTGAAISDHEPVEPSPLIKITTLPKLEFRIVPNSDDSERQPRENVVNFQHELHQRGFQPDQKEKGDDCPLVWREVDPGRPIGLPIVQYEGKHYVLLCDGPTYSVVPNSNRGGIKEAWIEEIASKDTKTNLWNVRLLVHFDQDAGDRLRELFRTNRMNAMAEIINGPTLRWIQALRNRGTAAASMDRQRCDEPRE